MIYWWPQVEGIIEKRESPHYPSLFCACGEIAGGRGSKSIVRYYLWLTKDRHLREGHALAHESHVIIGCYLSMLNILCCIPVRQPRLFVYRIFWQSEAEELLKSFRVEEGLQFQQDLFLLSRQGWSTKSGFLVRGPRPLKILKSSWTVNNLHPRFFLNAQKHGIWCS